jgi:3-phosphoglycerate kinase
MNLDNPETRTIRKTQDDDVVSHVSIAKASFHEKQSLLFHQGSCKSFGGTRKQFFEEKKIPEIIKEVNEGKQLIIFRNRFSKFEA